MKDRRTHDDKPSPDMNQSFSCPTSTITWNTTIFNLEESIMNPHISVRRNKMGAEKLANRDGVLLIDRSGSMGESDTLSGSTRWVEAQETSIAFARELGKHDEDGIDLYTFNHGVSAYPSTTADKVKSVFAEKGPSGSTVLAPALQTIFDAYLAKKARKETKANGELLVVVTDGQPSDESAVAKTICNFTQKLDNGDDEYGILFLQIGKDPQAAAFLKRLDDDLEKQGAKFDIVDTKTMEDLDGMSMEAALMAALDD